jgi:hypothetical protein
MSFAQIVADPFCRAIYNALAGKHLSFVRSKHSMQSWLALENYEVLRSGTANAVS